MRRRERETLTGNPYLFMRFLNSATVPARGRVLLHRHNFSAIAQNNLKKGLISAINNCVFTSHLCLRILREQYKMLFTNGAQPSFHWFREEAPNVGDDTGFLQPCNPMDWNVAHIMICLAKNLHILGGDKNGSHHICLGWNLQNLGVRPNF
jgi:hypothetical protein